MTSGEPASINDIMVARTTLYYFHVRSSQANTHLCGTQVLDGSMKMGTRWSHRVAYNMTSYIVASVHSPSNTPPEPLSGGNERGLLRSKCSFSIPRYTFSHRHRSLPSSI